MSVKNLQNRELLHDIEHLVEVIQTASKRASLELFKTALVSDKMLDFVCNIGEPTDKTNTLRANIKPLVDGIKRKCAAFFQIPLALRLVFTASRACQKLTFLGGM